MPVDEDGDKQSLKCTSATHSNGALGPIKVCGAKRPSTLPHRKSRKTSSRMYKML